MLQIKKLTKKFNSKTVLNAIDLTVEKGSIAVLLGESGVGKSTLLRVLCNLEAPTSGTFFLDNKELDLKKVNCDHTVGMVFQQFNLFEHLTVLENITLPLTIVMHMTLEQAINHAMKLLRHYGLEDKKDTYAVRLSGGQKQRLAIARAIALQPKVMCFDEPTSALDPFLTGHIATTITRLAAEEGLIVLVATHDISLLEQLPCTIYLMREGTIIESAVAKDFYSAQERFPHIASFVSGHRS
jgi:polar amino acid transport system ATP-binding protein